MRNVFFAEENTKGLTETSASHLCAVATQVKTRYEEILADISFVNSYIDIVGTSSEPKQTGAGATDLTPIDEAISVMSRMNAFISWFAEARTAIEEERSNVNGKVDLKEWAKEQGREYPEKPVRPEEEDEMDMEDAIKTLTVAERQKYLELEAKASVYGQFIHKNCPMDKARKAVHEATTKPYDTDGRGKDTIIVHREPSIAPEAVDEKFNQLQYEYREVEKELNQMKSQLRKKLDAMRNEQAERAKKAMGDYDKAMSQYESQIALLRIDMGVWKNAELERVSRIRLTLPKELEETYTYLSNLK